MVLSLLTLFSPPLRLFLAARPAWRGKRYLRRNDQKARLDPWSGFCTIRGPVFSPILLLILLFFCPTWLSACANGSTPHVKTLPTLTLSLFAIPASGSSDYLSSITEGPDGNLWFTDLGAEKIGRITPTGVTSEFDLSHASYPDGITAGPDGNLWFTAYGNTVGRITLSGAITIFRIAQSSGSIIGITAGPDGNLWFLDGEGNHLASFIGRMTPHGVVTPFADPRLPSSYLVSIATGPDGNLWFTEQQTIGRITPMGKISRFAPLPPQNQPTWITRGPHDDLWFLEPTSNKIGRITLQGAISEYAVPTAQSGLQAITLGPDGNLWFTENRANKIGRITPTGVISEFAAPVAPLSITPGPDKTLWFIASNRNEIGRITLSL